MTVKTEEKSASLYADGRKETCIGHHPTIHTIDNSAEPITSELALQINPITEPCSFELKVKKSTVNPTTDTIETSLAYLNNDVKRITCILLDLAKNDSLWWKENLLLLAHQPLSSLKYHLILANDHSFADINITQPTHPDMSTLEPLEALVWLAGLCQLDRLLIGVLPRHFVEMVDLQWQVLALLWLK